MIKKILLFAFIVMAFGISGMDKTPSDADKKAVLKQLREELAHNYRNSDREIRREAVRKAIISQGIHPDAIEATIMIDNDIFHIDNPLYEAVVYSDAEFVQFLLKHGADAQYVHMVYKEPLLIKAQDIEIARLLVNAGALYNDSRLLHRLTRKGGPALITFYGKKGIDSAAIDGSGCTALMAAVVGGEGRFNADARDSEIVRRLININVPLDARLKKSCWYSDKDATAAQMIKKQLVENRTSFMNFYIPQVFILAVKARNKNLKNMLEAHVSQDCAGVITTYLEDRALIDKDVKELEDVLHKKQLFELVKKENSQTPEHDAKKVAHLIATGMPIDISLGTQAYKGQNLSPIHIVGKRIIMDRAMHPTFSTAFLAAINDRKKHVAQDLDPYTADDLIELILEYYEDEESVKGIETGIELEAALSKIPKECFGPNKSILHN